MFACVLKLCNFSIVGAGALDSPLEGVRFVFFFTSHAGGQRLSRGRDVEGAVPYKCVVWLFGVVVKKHKW